MWDRSSIFEVFFLYFKIVVCHLVFCLSAVLMCVGSSTSEAVFTFGCRMLQLGETGTCNFLLVDFSCSYVRFDIHSWRLGWIEVATSPRIDVGVWDDHPHCLIWLSFCGMEGHL